MRARAGLVVALVMTSLLAGLVGMRSASGQTVLTLVVPASTQKARIINHHGPALRLGDRVAARGALTDSEGTRVGTGHVDCVVQRQITDPVTGLWHCSYLLDLADGDLMLRGLDPRGPGVYEMAVLGGTGAYANASGDATFTDTGDETGQVGATEMTIRLGS